jgi:hypothetical protein
MKSRAIQMGAILSIACLLPAGAQAFSGYPGVWASAYPGSQTDDNLIAGTGTACQLCHANSFGAQPWNGYGWAIRQQLEAGATITEAIAAVEGANSDLDPGGASNLSEIVAGTQPGWTPGPNNTLFFSAGSTTPSQEPPAAIAGDLDPPLVPALGWLGQLLLGAMALGGGLTALRARSA